MFKRIVESSKKYIVLTGSNNSWNYEGWNFNSGNYLLTTDTK